MEIKKNVEVPKRKRGGWKDGGRPLSEEAQAIYEFLNGNDKNICFTYKTEDEAYKRNRVIKQVIVRKNIPVISKKVGLSVFIERKFDK